MIIILHVVACRHGLQNGCTESQVGLGFYWMHVHSRIECLLRAPAHAAGQLELQDGWGAAVI